MSRLWHYTAEPFALEPRSYAQNEPRMYGKPEGFWVSVEGKDDWPSWCEGESFRIDELAHRAPVIIRPESNVLWLQPGSINSFDREFRVEWQWGPEKQWTDRAIDWRAVAGLYDGIVIAPYSWHHRLALSWYYTWDCASGCIWNLDAIEVGQSVAVERVAEETSL